MGGKEDKTETIRLMDETLLPLGLVDKESHPASP
jgi:hypothetical protein